MDEKISRADLLRRGALGLTVLSAGPLVASCREEKRTVREEGAREVDPKWIGYREIEPIPTGFHWARDLSVFDGQIVVAGDMALRQFDRDGKVLATHPLKETVRAVAHDPDGSVWVATDREIAILDKDRFVPLEGVSFGPSARVVGLTVTVSQVIVSDAANRSILRYTASGKPIGRMEGFVVPSPYFGIAVDGGDLLVCNPGRHRVERYAHGETAAGGFGKQGQEIGDFCGCCNPTNLAVMPNGDIVTSEKGLPRVKVLSPTGELKKVVAGPKAFDFDAAGLALAVDGNRILVLEPQRAQVRRFEEL